MTSTKLFRCKYRKDKLRAMIFVFQLWPFSQIFFREIIDGKYIDVSNKGKLFNVL